MELKPGTTKTALVNNLGIQFFKYVSLFHKNEFFHLFFSGRFDCYSAVFHCCKCKCSRVPTVEEYIVSGYWPGSASNENYFFEEQSLLFNYHLRHKSPGLSMQKVVETLEKMSSHDNRVC